MKQITTVSIIGLLAIAGTAHADMASTGYVTAGDTRIQQQIGTKTNNKWDVNIGNGVTITDSLNALSDLSAATATRNVVYL